MILVTVGMHSDGFSRLVEGMDRLAAGLDEEVVMQTGATRYEPKNARWFAYVPFQEMEALVQKARIVVSHAGAGSILSALLHNKPLVIMPRLQKYGEHMDDHQLELAGILAQRGALLVAYEVDQLAARLQECASLKSYHTSRNSLVTALRREADLLTRKGA